MIFAIAARDELWTGGRRIEARLMHGIARQEGDQIIARDDADPALLAACDEAMSRASALAQTIDARVRVVVRATAEGVETTFTVTINGVSIVSTPAHLLEDIELLRKAPLGQLPTANCQLVWHHGSGAVWFDTGPAALPSASLRRKQASAMIAKIPLPLSRHIAAVYRP